MNPLPSPKSNPENRWSKKIMAFKNVFFLFSSKNKIIGPRFAIFNIQTEPTLWKEKRPVIGPRK